MQEPLPKGFVTHASILLTLTHPWSIFSLVGYWSNLAFCAFVDWLKSSQHRSMRSAMAAAERSLPLRGGKNRTANRIVSVGVHLTV